MPQKCVEPNVIIIFFLYYLFFFSLMALGDLFTQICQEIVKYPYTNVIFFFAQ